MRVRVLVTGALLAAVTTTACAQILGGFDNRGTGAGGAGTGGSGGSAGGGGTGGATSATTSATSSGTSSNSTASSSSGSPKQNGEPCAQANECASDNCAPHGDGTSVCCSTACSTPCMTCDGSGICGNAAVSFADPRCGPVAVPQCTQGVPSAQLCECNGMGACKLTTGAYCQMDADCLNGTCVWMSPAAVCN